MVLIADKLGIIPRIPDSLYQAAFSDRSAFGMELMTYAAQEPSALKNMPFILAKTLGEKMGSANLAALWGMLQVTPGDFRREVERAGFTPGPDFGEQLFQAICDHPEGLIVGRCDKNNNFEKLRTKDGRVNLHIPEMEQWVRGIDARSEELALAPDPSYPLVLNAGRHTSTNANTLMRDPSWNDGRRACTLAMNPSDAKDLGLSDGQQVRVVTEAGEAVIELEVTGQARKGQVIIPHGFGLVYEGIASGVNVNRLTRSSHRDRFAGTPLHRYVPCRVEPAS
jgi:formylmethanofuran dehydrogenase subunit D